MRGMHLHTLLGLGLVREAAAVAARAVPSGELMAGRAAFRLRCPLCSTISTHLRIRDNMDGSVGYNFRVGRTKRVRKIGDNAVVGLLAQKP